MFKKGYKHGVGTLPESCGINMMQLQKKQKEINNFIANCNGDKKNKFYRSQIVEKMESLFTKRELAFVVQQYSEVIQAKTKSKKIDYDPAICFKEI